MTDAKSNPKYHTSPRGTLSVCHAKKQCRFEEDGGRDVELSRQDRVNLKWFTNNTRGPERPFVTAADLTMADVTAWVADGKKRRPEPVKVDGNNATARQRHGFKYEEAVRSRFGLKKFGKQTDPYDAIRADGRKVSIKTKKQGCAVEFASWHRHLAVTENFLLIVGFWAEDSSIVAEELLMEIPADEWRKHFPTEWVPKIENLFQGVSHEHSFDEEWESRRKAFQKEYQEAKKENGWIVNMAPKRDHKKQLRMQCSISYSDIQDLYEKYGVKSI